MEKFICKDYDAMCQRVANHIIKYIQNKPNSVLELPGGDTPLGIFHHLILAANNKDIDLSKVAFVSLDEWENLGYETKGSCIQTLFDNLYNHLAIDIEKQVCYFDGLADLQEECKRMDAFIKQHGGIDIAVLGIGMNGHIGFNEPGVDADQYSTVVPLDEVTTGVSVKYFGKQLNIKHGITLGIKHFYEAKEVILIADGIHKADIVKKVVEGEPTNLIPASLMQNAKNCKILMDEAAASKLTK